MWRDEYLRAVANADFSTLQILDKASDQNLDRNDLEYQVERRFMTRNEDLSPDSGNAYVDALVASYRGYWVRALTHPREKDAAESALARQLQVLLMQAGIEPREDENVFTLSRQAASQAGFHALLSVSPPLLDLVVWKTTEEREYTVPLSDGSEQVSVIFLDDLVSQGWSHFASLGLTATSGWTDGNVLYCVRWAYDPDTEQFRVSYLQHEARHMADYRNYPGISEDDLEYRAKLTELAFTGSSVNFLLRRFASEADETGPSAHARANSRVAREMYRELFGQPISGEPEQWPMAAPFRVNEAARVLLERDSEDRASDSG